MYKKIKVKSILWIVIAAMTLTGCATIGVNSAKSHEVVDGLGRTVSLPVAPMRIISLAPSNTELLFAVGAGPQVVGRDEFSDYPAEAQNVASVGGSMGKYSLEQIAALKPDLILAAEINTPEQVKSMEDLGLNVYFLSNPVDLKGVLENISFIGSLVGKEKEASQLTENLQTRIDTITSAINSQDQPVKVFYELDGTSDPAKPWTVGSGTYIDELISMAGGVNVASEAGPGYLQLSQEALIVADPEVILLGDAAYGVTPESLAERTGWSNILAVVNGRVYAFDDNLVSRPGPRLVDGLELIVALLHP